MLLIVAMAAVVLGVGLTIALVNNDVETASSPNVFAEPEEAPISGSTPEEPEEEPTSQLSDEERFEALKTKLNIEKASTH
jgi:hypothetical protein